MPTWDDNKQLLAGLWPHYEPSDAERDLFAEALAGLNQDDVREAIRDVRSTTRNEFKPPLSEIIHAAKSRRLEALAFRRTPRQWSIDEDELESQRLRTVASLKRLKPERLRETIEFAYAIGFVERAKRLEERPPDLWTRTTAMFILSLEQLLRENPSMCRRLIDGSTVKPPGSVLARVGGRGQGARKDA